MFILYSSIIIIIILQKECELWSYNSFTFNQMSITISLRHKAKCWHNWCNLWCGHNKTAYLPKRSQHFNITVTQYYSRVGQHWNFLLAILLQSNILVIIGNIACIETKYAVKLDLYLNLVHYCGPCSILKRHSYKTTAQFAVKISVWGLMSVCVLCLNVVFKSYNCIKMQ